MRSFIYCLLTSLVGAETAEETALLTVDQLGRRSSNFIEQVLSRTNRKSHVQQNVTVSEMK